MYKIFSKIIKEEEEEECISEEVRMERYEALISLENCDVIPNSESIECPICFVTYGPQEGVILRDCLHMFCRYLFYLFYLHIVFYLFSFIILFTGPASPIRFVIVKKPK